MTVHELISLQRRVRRDAFQFIPEIFLKPDVHCPKICTGVTRDSQPVAHGEPPPWNKLRRADLLAPLCDQSGGHLQHPLPDADLVSRAPQCREYLDRSPVAGLLGRRRPTHTMPRGGIRLLLAGPGLSDKADDRTPRGHRRAPSPLKPNVVLIPGLIRLVPAKADY